MSRYTMTSDNKQYCMVFAKDHACGWFAQIWDTTLKTEAPIVDVDHLFDNLTFEGIRELAAKYGIDDYAVQMAIFGPL